VVAISVDPPERNLEHCRQLGYTFTFLSDTKAEVIRSYDLLHPGSGMDGGDTSRPAEFLLDSTRRVAWLNLTESYTVRARPEQVLEALDEMGKTAPPRE